MAASLGSARRSDVSAKPIEVWRQHLGGRALSGRGGGIHGERYLAKSDFAAVNESVGVSAHAISVGTTWRRMAGLQSVRRVVLNAPSMATPRRAIQGPKACTARVKQHRDVLEGLASTQYLDDLQPPIITLFPAVAAKVFAHPRRA
ncbi:hypothetical protein TRAPUB_7413 [Trametes pubescens]|uniref:Uncharacterized protein n=1 Tax=Trametes pubescens TaxID=154538 RepID=A0A1M2V3G6_TRAPU|nr:hypothetical protein TRAPUB_7413 [Trametes pubescens]